MIKLFQFTASQCFGSLNRRACCNPNAIDSLRLRVHTPSPLFSSLHHVPKLQFSTTHTTHTHFAKLAQEFASLKCITYSTLISMIEDRERRQKEEWKKNPRQTPIIEVNDDQINETQHAHTQRNVENNIENTTQQNINTKKNSTRTARKKNINQDSNSPHNKNKEDMLNDHNIEYISNQNDENTEQRNFETDNNNNNNTNNNTPFQSIPTEEEIKSNLPPTLEFPILHNTSHSSTSPTTFQHLFKLLNCEDTLTTPNGGQTTVKKLTSLVIQLQKSIINHNGWMVNGDHSHGVSLHSVQDKVALLAFSDKSLFDKYGYLEDREKEVPIITTGRDLVCSLIPSIQEKYADKFLGVILDNCSGHTVQAVENSLVDLCNLGNSILVEDIIKKFWKTNKWENTFELQNVMTFPFHILKQNQDSENENSTLTIISENQQPPAYLIGFTSLDKILDFVQHSVHKELYDTQQINGEDVYQILKQSQGDLEGIAINPPNIKLQKNKKGVYQNVLRLKDFVGSNEGDQM